MTWSVRNAKLLAAALLITLSCAIPAVNASEPSSDAMHTVSTADHTATVQIPAGWTLAKGVGGFVFVTGPNDERISLGTVIVAKNAPGAGDTGDVMALPFSTSLKQKFATFVQNGAARGGMPALHVTFASEAPTKLAGCSQFLGGWTSGSDTRKFEGVLCSLQPDVLGFYKNLMFLAQGPARLALQDRPIVEKIAQSYRVTPATFTKMLAPYTTAPPAAAGGGGGAAPGMAPYHDPTNADCFDYNLIRQSPPWEVPMHCGGHMPG